MLNAYACMHGWPESCHAKHPLRYSNAPYLAFLHGISACNTVYGRYTVHTQTMLCKEMAINQSVNERRFDWECSTFSSRLDCSNRRSARFCNKLRGASERQRAYAVCSLQRKQLNERQKHKTVDAKAIALTAYHIFVFRISVCTTAWDRHTLTHTHISEGTTLAQLTI